MRESDFWGGEPDSEQPGTRSVYLGKLPLQAFWDIQTKLWPHRHVKHQDFCGKHRGYPSYSTNPPTINNLRTHLTCPGNSTHNALNPFHMICTPMHTSRNDVSCKITVIPVVPRIFLSRSANP